MEQKTLNINGKEYALNEPKKVQSYHEMCEYLRWKPLRDLSEKKSMIPKEILETLYIKTYNECATRSINQSDFNDFANSIEGQIFFIYLSLDKAVPLDELTKCLMNKEKIND